MERIDEVAARMRAEFGDPPDVAVVLGSGLGGFASRLTDAKAVAYPELGLPPAGVAGHAGTLSVGTFGRRRVAVFAGRWHWYEGLDMASIVLGVRALARWGGRGLVLTSAVGGITPGLATGDILIVNDHLNLLGASPLRGPNIDALGVRFPDLSAIYTPKRRALAHASANHLMTEGVYAAMPGPSYETPAEVRMLRGMGADVVGMSLVPEAIAAGHAGIDLLALAVIANPAAGLAAERLTHADVTAAMAAAADKLGMLLQGVISRW